jgi:hypothetical protein
MRWWWLSIVIACSAPARPPPPQPPPPPPSTPDARPAEPVVRVHRPIVLAVFALEARDAPSARVAGDLTLYLRNRAREDAHTQLTPDRELADEKLLNDCDSEAPPCMARIGNSAGAEYVLYGRVSSHGTQFDVALTLLEVASQHVWSWTGLTTGERAALESLANGAYDELTSHVPAT